MNKKYFFFDVDGTLTVSDPGTQKTVVPKSTRQALKQLKENGHFVSIATGRAHWMTREVARLTDIDNLVTDGGNGIVLDGQLAELLPLPPQKAGALCTALTRDGRGVGVTLHDDNRLYFVSEASARQAPDFSSFMEYIIDETLDFSKEKIYKIFVTITEEEEKLYPILETMPHMRYHPNHLMIEPADKYAGITRVMEYLGGNMEDVVVFGDGWNDMDMFLKAPFSVAMGNAVSGLKDVASFVTKPADKDGIAYACRHFGWI